MSEEVKAQSVAKGARAAFPVNLLNRMANRFKIATSQSKEALVLAIKESQKKQIALNSLETRSSSVSTYRKDKNTLPRIINLVLRYPDALARSAVIATRLDLQDREVGPNKPIWVRV